MGFSEEVGKLASTERTFVEFRRVVWMQFDVRVFPGQSSSALHISVAGWGGMVVMGSWVVAQLAKEKQVAR